METQCSSTLSMTQIYLGFTKQIWFLINSTFFLAKASCGRSDSFNLLFCHCFHVLSLLTYGLSIHLCASNKTVTSLGINPDIFVLILNNFYLTWAKITVRPRTYFLFQLFILSYMLVRSNFLVCLSHFALFFWNI